MSGRVINCTQGDTTWLFERTGRVTASRIGDVMAKLKNGKSSQARETYKMELLTEILTGRAAEHYVSMAMDWGIETEPIARSNYEMAKGVEVERVGLVIHPSIERSAASPDGLVGSGGLLEIKCPNTTTHVRYLLDGTVPEDYKPQMLWQMACTERDWCDFVSYDPRLPSEYGLFIVRFERDNLVIREMEAEVLQFISEVEEMAQKLLKYKKASAVVRAEIPA
jgi:putative phage-type endonuclease